MMLKIGLFLSLFLFLIGAGIAAHHIFFERIEIKIEQIEWIDEFKIKIAEIELGDKPCFLVIKPENSEIISEREFRIQKQGVEIGECANSKILIPLRVESKIKKNEDLFFVPQFRAKITGAEELKANFSLHLLTKDFLLSDLKISSTNVKSFSITERRKNILANEIKNLTNKHNYVLVLEISPDLEIMRKASLKNLFSFSIIIENITPELIIAKDR